MDQKPEDIAADLADIQAAQKGDATAFRRLVEKYHSYIYNLCRRVTLNPQDAADQTQETFLSFYAHLKDYQPGLKLSNWLYTIALNQCRKQLRRKKIVRFFSLSHDEKLHEPPASGSSPDQGIRRDQSQALLDKLVVSLPESYRPVFILRYFEDRTEEEMAQILGITIENVRVRIHRARRLLWEKHGSLIKEYL